MTPKILSSCHPVGQPDNVTRSYIITLAGPWVKEPDRGARVTAEAALAHPFFS